MSAGVFSVIFFCLATGAGLGALFLLGRLISGLLGGGRLIEAVFDFLFCCLCGAAVFLCALAVDHGRLRSYQAGLQLLGGWAAVAAFSPSVSAFSKRFSKKNRKKGEKTGRKRKKAQKKT